MMGDLRGVCENAREQREQSSRRPCGLGVPVFGNAISVRFRCLAIDGFINVSQDQKLFLYMALNEETGYSMQ